MASESIPALPPLHTLTTASSPTLSSKSPALRSSHQLTASPARSRTGTTADLARSDSLPLLNPRLAASQSVWQDAFIGDADVPLSIRPRAQTVAASLGGALSPFRSASSRSASAAKLTPARADVKFSPKGTHMFSFFSLFFVICCAMLTVNRNFCDPALQVSIQSWSTNLQCLA